MRLSVLIFLKLTFLLNGQKIYPYLPNLQKAKTGIIYALPYNTINLTIEVKQTILEEGLFSNQASKFFSFHDDFLKSLHGSIYELKSIQYSIHVEPDFKRSFLFVPPGRKELTTYTSHFLLLAINDEPVNLIEPSHQFHISFNLNHSSSTSYFPIFNNSYWRTDTIKEKTFVDSVIIENIKVITKLTEKTFEEKGKEIADALNKIWQNKIELNSGTNEVGYEVSTLRYMNHQLDSIIQLYNSLFMGKKEEKIHSYSLTIHPIQNDTIYLFSINEKKGLIVDSNYAKKYYAVFQMTDNLTHPYDVTKPSQKLPGIPYVIPATVRFSILEEDKELFSNHILVAQLGSVAFLPYRTKKVQFHPLYGYPIKISVGAKVESSTSLPPVHYGDGQN
ncbi:MAG: DUF4831 family protein [Bacteroidales bacterium]|nr:DUF4831 family protein [Bacteroidales bacterium]